MPSTPMTAGDSPDSDGTVVTQSSYPPPSVIPDWKPYKVDDVPPPDERQFKPRRTRKARLLRFIFGFLVFAGLVALASYFIWRHFHNKSLPPPPGWQGLDPATVQPLDPNFRYRDLSQPFEYGKEPIRGVNVGGWLVTEPFLNPTLYGKYPGTIDEWTLSVAMGSNLTAEFENHYATYYTESDFARIAQMGLNHIRIPFAHWAYPNEAVNGEPFYYGGSWKWLLKAVEWARKYGLRVCLDLHTAVGSQNGYDHSGRSGEIQFLNGTYGQANAERTRQIIQQISDFFFGGNRTTPDGVPLDHVTIFSTMNEPFVATINFDGLKNWYGSAYDTIRNSSTRSPTTSPRLEASLTSTRANLTFPNANWPGIVINDGFSGEYKWFDQFPADAYTNVWMDFHKYVSLNNGTDAWTKDVKFATPCNKWRDDFVGGMQRLGPIYMGEWSASWYSKSESNFTKMTAQDKQDLAIWTQIQMDVAERWGMGWFFWNLRTEKSMYAQWDYYVGVDQGWIPRNLANRTYACPPIGTKANYCTGGSCYGNGVVATF
ncbi:hypothetical protein HDV00_005027 [Rhizophlyctis rosea]|nr:hypothetical protein HDV00_005027 [Rhizophlyctis rosea]